MPTDDIQTDLIEPDSPDRSSTSDTFPIPELWAHAPHNCSLHLEDDRWRALLDDSLAQDFWTAATAIPDAEDGTIFNFGFIWTDADHITKLNGGFRGKDTATNVLSFPDGTADPETGTLYLGDIFLCWDVMVDEAEKQHISLRDHSLHLMLHGLLHLLGYDHVKTDEAMQMEALETALLAKLDIADPYSLSAAEQ